MAEGALLYLSGKMTVEPNYREIFEFYEEVFEEEGFEVLNPVRISDAVMKELKLTQKEAFKEKYRNLFLIEAVKGMLECDIVVMLPNWKTSRGAKVEHEIAELLGMEILYVEEQRN